MQWSLDSQGKAAFIVAVGIVIAASVAGYALVQSRATDNYLSVTGSTKERITADSVRWMVRTERIVVDTATAGAYAQVAADTARIKKFLKQNEIKDEDITISPIAIEDYYGPGDQYTRRVAVRQLITVQSKEVDRVATAAQGTVVLAQQGVQFSPQQPEYLITNLPELRVKLLGAAIVDARARATEIAKASGQRIGKMQNASSGVVQVLAPDSIDVSDYGQYDTQSLEKDVMVTVRASFVLK